MADGLTDPTLRQVLGRGGVGGVERGCTSPDQNDHKTHVRRVLYPCHPLFGQEVIVRGQIGGKTDVFRLATLRPLGSLGRPKTPA